MLRSMRCGRPVVPDLIRCLALLFAIVLTQPLTPSAAADDSALPDFPVANGHFYSQASGKGYSYGYVVSDDGAPFLSAFDDLGGSDSLGYPVSSRFVLEGLPAQATQKTILQWQPDRGRVVPVNIFDIFTSRGFDGSLLTRQIPPTGDNTPDAGLSWSEVVKRHLALLDVDPAIKARYFADPDPIQHFGLPQGVGSFGGVYVVRCQRAAFQHWKIATPFARAGDVTVVNAGDLAKELGLIPSEAAAPVPSASLLITPLGAPIPASHEVQIAARSIARDSAPSIVRLDVTFPSGLGVGSGILLDGNGDILTNEHVVDLAVAVQATFANGVTLPAQIVGVDRNRDVAVVQVPPGLLGEGVKPARLVSGIDLRPGQPVVAIGFSPFFPAPPATRLGIYQQTLHQSIDLLRTNTYVLPGDSGGPLVDLAGDVVGINDEVSFTQQPRQPLVALSIDAGQASEIAQMIIRGGLPPEAYLGAETITVTPNVEQSLRLPTGHGALVVGVSPASPAQRAGIAPGDVIVQAAGQGVRTAVDLREIVARQPPGGKLSVTFIGLAGRREVTVVLGAWPKPSGR